jgi:uncharacterized Zn finger protein
MSDAQLNYKHSARETQRHCCPMCRAHMEVLRVVTGRPGFEHRTLRCTKCGLVHEAQAAADPINSESARSTKLALR